MLKESVNITDEILTDFIDSTTEFLSEVDRIVYSSKEDSHVAKEIDGRYVACSVLTVFIRSQFSYDKLNLDPHRGNWNDSFVHSLKVKKIWNALMDRHGLSDDINTKIEYLFFNCSNADRFLEVVYASKSDILKKLNDLGLPKPNYLFANSKPGYSIVLANQEKWKLYSNFGVDRLTEETLNVLTLLAGESVSGKISIELYHEKMDSLNLYGLSRED